ncbi:MAG TPA: hypothetical protein VMB18_13170, partial [Terriglobales bacterium]|nr:hypothetical protein [Terriglobales bacterium]
MIQRNTIEDDIAVHPEDEPMFAVSLGITEIDRFDVALPTIAAHTIDALDNDFFSSLVRHLAMALEVRYAFVTECLDEKKTRARSLAFWCGGKFEQNFEYETAPTPCRKVLDGRICYYPKDLQSLFPKDGDLANMKA